MHHDYVGILNQNRKSGVTIEIQQYDRYNKPHMTYYQYLVSCLYADHRSLGHSGRNWSPAQVFAAIRVIIVKQQKSTNCTQTPKRPKPIINYLK